VFYKIFMHIAQLLAAPQMEKWIDAITSPAAALPGKNGKVD
jgi:hypothetical protein